MDIDFTFGENSYSLYVRFDEHSSKNHKLDLFHCQPKCLHKLDVVTILNIVLTFHTFYDHQPKWQVDESPLHPLIPRPLDGLSKESNVINVVKIWIAH